MNKPLQPAGTSGDDARRKEIVRNWEQKCNVPYLFEAGRLLNFHHFQQVVSLFCNKITNREDVPKHNLTVRGHCSWNFEEN